MDMALSGESEFQIRRFSIFDGFFAYAIL